jgi:hypothetical protein
MSNHRKYSPIEVILRSWLDDADLTLFCGHWGNGGIMELLPHGSARLSGPRYAAPFDGLRELRLAGGAHHVHLDLGRLTHAWYVVAPSVCYGYRPSFELRLTSTSLEPLNQFGLGVALTRPYAGCNLRVEPVRRYFRRATEHIDKFPDAVSFMCDRANTRLDTPADWDCIESLLAEAASTFVHSTRSVWTALRHSSRTAASV